MAHLNPFKIYSLAILYLILPGKLGCYFYFIRKTPTESLAIGTAMTKIKYWRHFIKKHKRDNKLYFTLSKCSQ